MSLDRARQKLDDLESRYEMLGAQMMDPVVTSDNARYVQISKQWSELTELVTTYREFKSTLEQITDAMEMQNDAEMRELATMELAELRPRRDSLERGA